MSAITYLTIIILNLNQLFLFFDRSISICIEQVKIYLNKLCVFTTNTNILCYSIVKSNLFLFLYFYRDRFKYSLKYI